MSTIEPDDDAVLAAMEEQLGEVEILDGVNVKELSDLALSELFNETRDWLLEHDEMEKPHTEMGRAKHSTRAACLIEMAERKMR